MTSTTSQGYGWKVPEREHYRDRNNNDFFVESGDPNLFAPPSFSDKGIRMAFIRKVYGILLVQLLVTFGLTAAFSLNNDLKLWIRGNLHILYISVAVTLIVWIALLCCEKISRKTPHNFILLAAFTVAEGMILGMLASFINTNSVLLAIGITTVICLALTVYAFQTKHDFTTMGMALTALFLTFFIFSILMMFFPRSSFPTLHVVFAAGGALLFSLHFIYDTQLMIGGKHKYAISPEEYIFAALSLYLDVINIFLYILSLLQSSDN